MWTWMAAQWLWLKSALEEEGGKLSHRRLLTVALVFSFVLSYGKRVVLSPVEAPMLDIPDNWLWLILGALGISAAAPLAAKKAPPEGVVK